MVPTGVVVSAPLPGPLSIVYSPDRMAVALPIIDGTPVDGCILVSNILADTAFSGMLGPTIVPVS